MKHTQIKEIPNSPFNFALSAYSHGWVNLAPNCWLEEEKIFQRIHLLASGQVVKLSLQGKGSIDTPMVVIDIEHHDPLSGQEEQQIRQEMRHIFRMDEDFSPFYARCSEAGSPWEDMTRGLGRLLRSPTVFEDIVKTILTTNIQWGGTKRMSAELVQAFGKEFPGDPSLKAFPAPADIAILPYEEFENRVRLGYRAPYIHELAVNIHNGEINLQKYLSLQIETDQLHKELLSIKGIGPYAAASMLMLLGRYDKIGVDTVFREFVKRKYFNNEKVSDAEMLAIYDNWGKWKYLAYWFDIWKGFQEAV